MTFCVFVFITTINKNSQISVYITLTSPTYILPCISFFLKPCLGTRMEKLLAFFAFVSFEMIKLVDFSCRIPIHIISIFIEKPWGAQTSALNLKKKIKLWTFF